MNKHGIATLIAAMALILTTARAGAQPADDKAPGKERFF